MNSICGVHHKDSERAKDLMLMLVLIEGIDQLAMVNSVHRYGHVLRREWLCLEKGIGH